MDAAEEKADRRVAAGIMLASGTVLVIAAWLDPAPQGHGTHLQLGLLPCSFLALTGIPCPMCGATTTFALMAHGRWLAGFANQPFAAILFFMTAGSCAVSALEVVRPRRRLRAIANRAEPYELLLASLFLAAMCLGWTWKMWQFSGP